MENLYQKFLKALAEKGWVEAYRGERWAEYHKPPDEFGLSVPLERNSPDFMQALTGAIECFEDCEAIEFLPRYQFRNQRRTIRECADFLGMEIDAFWNAGIRSFTFKRATND